MKTNEINKDIVKKERNSNYELLRIVAMFMIVSLHIILHGKVIENIPDGGMTYNLVNILLFFTMMFTSTFVLITGYFQCEKEFKLKTIFKLNNAMWFYSSILGIVMFVFELVPNGMTKTELMMSVSPIQFNSYWFIKMYICLYAITPFLNITIKHITQKQHKALIFTSLFMFALIPTLTNNLFYNGGAGYTIVNFVILYFIGAYFKKYPIQKSRLFEKSSKYKISIIFLFILFMALFVDFLAYKFGMTFTPGKGMSGYIYKLFAGQPISYCNPLNILGSVSIFILFGLIKINSKFVNRLAGLTTGVYLIHEYEYLNDVLYSWFGFANINNIGYKVETNIFVLVRILIIAMIIFVVCSIIEFIRQLIFKFIYNRKVSKKCRDKFYDILNNF